MKATETCPEWKTTRITKEREHWYGRGERYCAKIGVHVEKRGEERGLYTRANQCRVECLVVCGKVWVWFGFGSG